MTLLLPILAFLFVSLLVAAGVMVFSTSGGTAIERRLGEVTGASSTFETDSRFDEVVVDALKKLGNAVPPLVEKTMTPAATSSETNRNARIGSRSVTATPRS